MSQGWDPGQPRDSSVPLSTPVDEESRIFPVEKRSYADAFEAHQR